MGDALLMPCSHVPGSLCLFVCLFLFPLFHVCLLLGVLDTYLIDRPTSLSDDLGLEIVKVIQ